MLFSIATPTFNAITTLKACVGSVRNQHDVKYEHIIQDGSSQDGTDKWLENESALRWQSEPDDGMYDAINKAWARAEGDVLSYLNADEQYLPGTLALVEKAFKDNPDVDVVFGDYLICNSTTGAALSARREIPLRRAYLVNGPVLYAMSCTLFFRRRLLDAGDLTLDTKLKVMGDFDLVIRLIDKGCKFMHIPEYLSIFGATGQNLSEAPNAAIEASTLYSQYGGAKTKAVRYVIKLFRCIEKLLNGCYNSKTVCYDFCEDETGKTRRITEKKLSTTWRLTSQ